MKKIIIYLASILLLISCSDPCNDVTCNDGICEEGTCICSGNFFGEDCSLYPDFACYQAQDLNQLTFECSGFQFTNFWICRETLTTNSIKITYDADNTSRSLLGTIDKNLITFEDISNVISNTGSYIISGTAEGLSPVAAPSANASGRAFSLLNYNLTIKVDGQVVSCTGTLDMYGG
ncbi:MAG: hypothetical protein MRY83_21380 [Flavobacteriales bacterium]|nr:hypothetical protein [Flavobacteriales bacterium]